MNRYSLIFAVLVASSMIMHSPGPESGGAGASASSGTSSSRVKTHGAMQAVSHPKGSETGVAQADAGARSLLEAPLQVIQRFLGNIDNSAPPPSIDIKVLFATLPHPIETHLSAAFDQDLEALQDGIQAAGFVFDSSYIPWSRHEPRELYDDDEKEGASRKEEDSLPGILLFRRSASDANTYSQGLLVFLFTEQPTQGVAVNQAPNAISLLRLSRIPFKGPIRILGPNYTGSLASLVSVVTALHDANPDRQIRVRSGSVSGGGTAAAVMAEISKRTHGTFIDFGSTQYDNPAWTLAAVCTLKRIGIDSQYIATLSENQTSYGGEQLGVAGVRSSDQRKGCNDQVLPTLWSLSFPRDISSLRAGYEKQGILQNPSLNQPWQKVLELSSEDESEGDTVKSFGGSATIAAQESVLFGISEFLKTHGIRAVIISATNEEDRYFLSQFLHAHNSDVRIVVTGTSRMFMRGQTAQFRGDLVIDDFPFFSRLHSWTWGGRETPAYVFANDVAQGTFFAAIDLLADEGADATEWHPEYSEPSWNGPPSKRYPPMYVVALGGYRTWPVSELAETPFQRDDPTQSGPNSTQGWKVRMPFALVERSPQEKPGSVSTMRTPLPWRLLFLSLVFCTALYCVAFWCANSAKSTLFASFEPSRAWRFWLFRVAIPAAVFGSAFRLLSWTNEMPAFPNSNVLDWGSAAEAMTMVAPFAIAISAVVKMLIGPPPKHSIWMAIPFVPVFLWVMAHLTTGYSSPHPFAGLDVGSILTHYREMHWESGLSLVPTSLLFLLALFVWATQAGNGAMILETAPRLPVFPGREGELDARARGVLSAALPIPATRRMIGFWAVWTVAALIIVTAHFTFPPYRRITTLESLDTTRLLLTVSMTVVILLIFDLIQFLWVWKELRTLLQALDRQTFKRSFVPISNFRWKNLWSFKGTSLDDRGDLAIAQLDCVLDLAMKHKLPEFRRYARALNRMRNRYNDPSVATSTRKRRSNRVLFVNLVHGAANQAAILVAGQRYIPPQEGGSPRQERRPTTFVCKCENGEGRFQDELKELEQLPEWQQTAERLLCLVYISFIQTLVARLHTMLISVASLFSLVTLGFAIYPFAPLFPLLMSGLILIAMIAWVFYKVISEMDTDRTLSRIVNGDDRKLEKEFYFKYAGSLALPLLTLGSSFLPGGAGRLLEMVQTLFSHAE